MYPHAFAWYCIVSRFTPEVRAQWAGLKPLKGADWKNVLDPEPKKVYNKKHAQTIEENKKLATPNPRAVDDEFEKVQDKKKKTPKGKKDEEFEDDIGLFDSEDSDDEEAAEAKKQLKRAAEESKKPKKAAPVAKSLVIWEVKPYGPETDLDVLGK